MKKLCADSKGDLCYEIPTLKTSVCKICGHINPTDVDGYLDVRQHMEHLLGSN